MSRHSLIVCSFLVLPACLEQQLDDAEPGLFACEDASDCEDDEFCVVGRCEADAPPTLQIRDPEQFEVVASAEGVGATMRLSVTIGGRDLRLVEPNTSGEVSGGEGYVEVSLDGDVVGELTSGSLAGGVLTQIDDFVAEPGPHRISVRALRADGTPFDNEEAQAVSLIWVDDGRPQVGIVRPLSGSSFDIGESTIEVEVATLNFSLVPAIATRPEPHGHAHIHYDDAFPACVDDPMCDCCYIAIASPGTADIPQQGFLQTWTESVTLPGASAGGGRITAVLRETNHTPFFDGQGATVFDSVDIARVDRGEP